MITLAIGQTATVSIDDYVAVPGNVDIAINYTNLDQIGAITLYFDYDPNVVSYVGFTGVDISGALVNTWQNGSLWRLGISWSDVNGLTSTGGVLMNITFNYISGSSAFDFDEPQCELGKLDGTVVNTIYTDGSIGPDPNAVPVTIISQLNQTPPFSYVEVPVEADFSGVANGGVGSFNFEIEYDPTILTFDQLTDEFATGFIVNTLTNPARVAVIWTTQSGGGTNINGVLFKMRFTYNGGNSDLTFNTTACEVADYGANVQSVLYTDGMVTQDISTMAQIIIDSTAAYAGDIVYLPVTVKLFNNVGAFDYVIDINEQVVQYLDIVNINPAIASGFLYNLHNDTIYTAYSGSSGGVTLADDAILFTLKLKYLGTNTPVTFVTQECSMVDWDLNPILPYYDDGFITEIPGGNVTVCMDTVVATQNTYVLMPVVATGFLNVGAITLEMNFDPAKLQYSGIQSEHQILVNNGSSFSNSVNGTFAYSWTVDASLGHGVDIPYYDTLFNIVFYYVTGTAPVTFNLQKCDIADWETISYQVSYCNGLVKNGIEVDIKAFLEGLYDPVNHQMNKAQDWDGSAFVDKWPGTVADVITVELHDAANYSNIVTTITDVELNQDGSASFELSELYTGTYYITIKNRNHIETVSKNSISFSSGNISYDFTTAATQAYGDNQTELETGVFGIYAGEINHDGFININDAGIVNASVLNGDIGYFVTDINGNGEVNINDAGIVNVNVLNGIEVSKP
jgi:hypothetical protein